MSTPFLDDDRTSAHLPILRRRDASKAHSGWARVSLFCVGLLAAMGLTSQVMAAGGELVQWHSTNVKVLRAGDYQVGDGERTILTLEHANGWTYGELLVVRKTDCGAGWNSNTGIISLVFAALQSLFPNCS